MSNQKGKLFTDFPPVTTPEWMEAVTKDLKGADFQKRLVWRTNEGFNVNPFCRAEDIEGLLSAENLPGQFPYIRGTKKDNVWFIRQDIDVDNYHEANQKALALLYKLEKATVELTETGKKIAELSEEFKAEYLAK